MRNGFKAAVPAALMLVFANHAVAGDAPATEQAFGHTLRQCVGTSQAVIDFNYGSAYGVILKGFEKQNGVSWAEAAEDQKVAWIDAATQRMDTLLKDYRLPQIFGAATMVSINDREEDVIEQSLHQAVTPLAKEQKWPNLVLSVENVRFIPNAAGCNKLQVSHVIR